MMLNRKRWHHYLLNISPWILAVACFLLIVLLGVFTFSNYQREKELLTEGIAQKGLTLIRFINSSVRTSIRDDLRSSESLNSSLWRTHMSEALIQASEHPGVDFILLLDSTGKLLASAGEKLQPEITTQTIAGFEELSIQAAGPDRGKSRIISDTNTNKRKIQLALRYLPPDLMGRRLNSPARMGGKRKIPHLTRHPNLGQLGQEFSELMRTRPYFIIQLDFEQFSSPLKRQLIQIIILTLVTMLVGLGGMLSLITLRGLRGSELRIGEMQAFTDILVSSLPVGLIATDHTGTIQICNDAVQDLLDISERDVKGKMVQACLVEEVALMFAGKQATDLDGHQREVELTSKAGDKTNLHLTSNIVFGKNGSFAGEVLLVRDLTEVKYLERELQRSERLAALGKMAAGVAHELRNPLSSIKGLAVLLKSIVGNTDQGAETAEILVKEVERLNRSIGELLDYAKPAHLEKEEASIVEILHKTKSLIEIDAKVYGVEIIIKSNADLPHIKIDKDKINQLFLNLFLNSLQAMVNGGQLEVTAALEQDAIWVNVRDTGVGIERENLSKVLDPYFTTKRGGTGLGLSMSSKIVEEHGGQIKITSKVGEYTNIRVTLPCR